jgi:hypothetical protein
VTRVEELGAWPARVLWFVLALVAAPSFSDALQGRSGPVAATVAVAAWGAWAAGVVALFVPRTTALTAVRLLVPAGAAATVWAVLAGDTATVLDVVAVAVAVLALAASAAPWVVEAFVDGSAYGPEQRTPLRTPPALALVAVLTWLLTVAGALAGPLLLAARVWLAGVVVLVLGWAVAAAGARSLHQLARRFAVVVSAGLVVHDPLTMPEPQLFLRRTIARVGPAEAPADAGNDDDGTRDLTAGAAGLTLELVLTEPVELLLRRGRQLTETVPATRVLFTPTRPRTLLDHARERRIPVA